MKNPRTTTPRVIPRSSAADNKTYRGRGKRLSVSIASIETDKRVPPSIMFVY